MLQLFYTAHSARKHRETGTRRGAQQGTESLLIFCISLSLILVINVNVESSELILVLQESITRLAEVEGNQVFAMDLQKMVNTTLSEVETADVRSRASVEATRTSSQRDAATAVVRTFVTLGAIGAHFGFWCIFLSK